MAPGGRVELVLSARARGALDAIPAHPSNVLWAEMRDATLREDPRVRRVLGFPPWLRLRTQFYDVVYREDEGQRRFVAAISLRARSALLAKGVVEAAEPLRFS